LAVGAEGHAFDIAGVALEGGEFGAGAGVPQPHRIVQTAAGQALAVGAEGHAADRAGVALEGGEVGASARMPQPQLCWERLPLRTIAPTATGQALAVGAEGHASDRAGVAVEGEEATLVGPTEIPPVPEAQLGRHLVKQSLRMRGVVVLPGSLGQR